MSWALLDVHDWWDAAIKCFPYSCTEFKKKKKILHSKAEVATVFLYYFFHSERVMLAEIKQATRVNLSALKSRPYFRFCCL